MRTSEALDTIITAMKNGGDEYAEAIQIAKAVAITTETIDNIQYEISRNQKGSASLSKEIPAEFRELAELAYKVAPDDIFPKKDAKFDWSPIARNLLLRKDGELLINLYNSESDYYSRNRNLSLKFVCPNGTYFMKVYFGLDALANGKYRLLTSSDRLAIAMYDDPSELIRFAESEKDKMVEMLADLDAFYEMANAVYEALPESEFTYWWTFLHNHHIDNTPNYQRVINSIDALNQKYS